MAQIQPVSDAEYARQKKEIADRCETFEVVGDAPVRDAVSRESIETGGTVRLDPVTTMISHLVASGAVRPMPKAKSAEKTPAA